MRRFHIALFPSLFAVFVTACGGGGGGSTPLPGAPATLYSSPNYLVALAFTPKGDLLFTELQTGAIRIIPRGADAPLPEPFARVPVPSTGAEGLLGIAVDPRFGSNGYIYVYHALPNPLRNRVVRYRAELDSASQQLLGKDPTVLLDGIPNGGHNGGKFVFDEDNHLIFSTGDAGNPANSQNMNTLAGKILRISNDGSVPRDNPFPGSPIYALGVRNSFGLSKDPHSDAIVFTDNGPGCNDEVNLLQPGANYGWRPGQACDDEDPRFTKPIFNIPKSSGITGALFTKNSRFSGLEDKFLYAEFNKGQIFSLTVQHRGGNISLSNPEVLYAGELGSPTDLAESSNGGLFFTTSNALVRFGD